LKKVEDYTPPRKALYVIGVAVGVAAGFANSFLDIDMSLRLPLLGWLLVSIIIVIILHEGTHSAVAALMGHKPLFGLKPPLVYVTFADKIPRGHFMVVAIAPFVVLNLLFGFLYARGILKLLSNFSLVINSIGSVADLWILLKLIGAPKGALVQDTKTGFEVWFPDETERSGLTNPKKV
jgi:hypothetical protein